VRSSITVGRFLLCNPRVKENRQAAKLVQVYIFFKKQAQNNQLKLHTNLSQSHNLSNTESPSLLFEWKELNNLLPLTVLLKFN